MMERPSLNRLIELQKLLNEFAQIERVIHIKRKDKITLESDTEHSYNLAMTTWFLADSFPNINQERAILLALVHDLVEVHAGDTFVFDTPEMLASKADREAAAQKRLNDDWPDFPSLHDAINEYETLQTPEACFVYALDKIIPMFTVYINDGYTWQERKMSLEKLNEEKRRKMSVSPELLHYWDDLYKLLRAKRGLFTDAG